MSVLEREDVARRVAEALKAAVAADAETPPVEISLAAEVVEPDTEKEPEVDDDDDWVVGPVELDEHDGNDAHPAVVPASVRPTASTPAELDPAEDARPKRSRLRVAVAAALLVTAAVGIWAAVASRSSGIGSANASPSAGGEPASDLPTLRGTFTVWNGGTSVDPCARVRSTDAPIAGDSVRLRATDGGRLIMSTLGTGSPSAAGRGCAYPFALRNVPPAEQYIVAVSTQGSLLFSRSQLDSVRWRVSMSAGSPSGS